MQREFKKEKLTHYLTMLSKKFLQVEIDKAKIAIQKLKEGLELNEIVLAAFENALICSRQRNS